MEMQEAVRAVRALADGVDPVTGEVFPKDSPYQKPHVIRALEVALQKMGATPIVQTGQVQPVSASFATPWTEEEDERLSQNFGNRIEFDEIARAHGRSRSAIISRLIGLGKIKPKALQAV